MADFGATSRRKNKPAANAFHQSSPSKYKSSESFLVPSWRLPVNKPMMEGLAFRQPG
jgi:hypothetical protein